MAQHESDDGMGGHYASFVARFMAQDVKLATLENEMAVVLEFKERIDGDFYNHGEDGVKTQWTKFISVYNEREDKRDKAWRNFRWSVMAFLALLTIFSATYVGLKANDQIQHNQLQLPKIFAPNTSGKVYSANEEPPDLAGGVTGTR